MVGVLSNEVLPEGEARLCTRKKGLGWPVDGWGFAPRGCLYEHLSIAWIRRLYGGGDVNCAAGKKAVSSQLNCSHCASRLYIPTLRPMQFDDVT